MDFAFLRADDEEMIVHAVEVEGAATRETGRAEFVTFAHLRQRRRKGGEGRR